jgi:hypothetical protein
LVWVIEDFRLAPPTFRWVGLAALETRKALIRSADNQRHLRWNEIIIFFIFQDANRSFAADQKSILG